MTDAKDLQQDTRKEQYESLVIENVKYRTLLTKKYKGKRDYARRDIKKIIAFLPGTVTDIYTAAKKKVKIGDKLMVLEAMKMRNDILSPLNGTVKKVFVKAGENVNKEKILVEFN